MLEMLYQTNWFRPASTSHNSQIPTETKLTSHHMDQSQVSLSKTKPTSHHARTKANQTKAQQYHL